ncbi:hypothetical protein DSCW_44200 [Desulfosarcina widdelii]|uniref:Uncharacterized protein n=1 Tax=Desulfosarcina widdelii TaxID=947919 RepID=A0A5K7ZB34_9BACT|nr:hypothetical protein [Desulfosarcina widdelii]BBO77003.1 hypothetical protein DSCW_44200 [Desulfosarcina widdelii]
MGEIKSTLDLVMERTRHLSLSDEEKTHQRKEDFRKRLQGLLQRYADGALTVEDLREKIKALQAELKVDDPMVAVTAVAGRMEPDRDNRIWLDLLAVFAPAVCGSLEAALKVYRRQRDDSLWEGVERLRRRLAQDHGISGTAVAPNPHKDPECQAQLVRLRQQAKSRLAAIVDEGSQPPQHNE